MKRSIQVLLARQSYACLVLLVSCVVCAKAATSRPTGVSPSIRQFYATALHFEPNVGQAGNGVQYIARGAGYGLFLGSSWIDVILADSGAEPQSAVRMSFKG